MRFGGFGYEQQFGFGLSPTPAASAAPAYAAWPALVGAEMMVNGDCSSGTGWGLPTGAGIAAGKMTLTALSDNVENDGINALLGDATYRFVFTIDTVSLGSVRWDVGGTLGTARSTTGTFSQDITAPAVSAAVLAATSATMQLDNFSVKSIGLLGQSSDWTLTGADISWASGGVSFGGSAAGETAALTGTALTDFNAGVSNSTACTVTLTQDPTSPQDGTISVTMKGGSPVNFDFTGGLPTVSHTVTSGAGSGFVLTSGSDFPGIIVVRIQIALA